MDEIKIKKLESKDEAEACARIIAESDPWKKLKFSYEECLQSFSEQLLEFYIAVEKNTTIGFISIQMEGAFTGYIKRICIHPGWRGKGIGTKLMHFAEDRIFSVKPNVFICVSSFNLKAKELYLKLGYEVIGEIKDYIVSGYSEIILRKTKGPIHS